ncbi:AAA family ATPase [Micromonospora sp. NPDC023644]|uniref:AAA family ATPase n=1 Tax=Micromonospora sp. NPDC023644 TaxID=3154321 RepID=UPI0033CFA1FE
MNLIERDHELAYLRSLLADGGRRDGGAVLVSGPPGSGKSALLHAFGRETAATGALVLTATGARAERAIPLGVLRQLLASAPLPRAARARVAALEERLGSRPGPGGRGRLDAATLRWLSELVLRLAADRPVVVVVDDVDHADHPSAQCLLFLARRLGSARIVLVFAERSAAPENRWFGAELLRQPHCVPLHLAPLSVPAVRELLAGVPGPVAAAYHRITGGSPALVAAVGADLRAAGAAAPTAGSVPVVGPAFGQAVVTCLYQAGPGLLAVARALAVLHAATTPALLARLTDAGVGTTEHAVRQLTAIGLLDRGGFRHPAAREAVLDDMDDETRARWHARAAELLHRDGAAPAAVARHLVASRRAGRPWQRRVLRRAAERALRAGRLDDAVEQLRLAREGTPAGPRHTELTALLTCAEWAVDPAVAGRYLPELVRALHAGELEPGAGIELTRRLVWRGQIEEAGRAVRRMSDGVVAGSAPAAELAAVRDWLSVTAPAAADGLPRWPVPAASAPGQSGAGPQPRAAQVLAAVLRGDAGEAVVHAAERVLHGVRLDATTLDPIADALSALLYAEHTDRAARWCDRFLEQATEQVFSTGAALLMALRAEIAVAADDLPAAEFYARTALACLDEDGWGCAIAMPRAALLLALTGTGRHDSAGEQLERPLPAGAERTRAGVRHRYARGRYWLAVGQPRAALADFLACGRLMAQWGVDVPALAAWRLGAAEANLRLGHPERARRLAAEQLDRCPDRSGRSYAEALRVAAAASAPPDRIALLREATRVFQGAGHRAELARSLTELSQAYRAHGDQDEARSAARRAARAARWTVEPGAARRPGPAGPAGVGAAELSEAERRVGALAVLGHTNREIAGRLHITVSTVEQHLTQAYRKLGISRRTQLPASLGYDLAPAGRDGVAAPPAPVPVHRGSGTPTVR